ncbi:unnamed protein product [Rhizophagus irregularis]|nr:unnamed protein product [Rhizophagus irregularis]
MLGWVRLGLGLRLRLIKMDSCYNDNVYVYENDAENCMSSLDNNIKNDFYEDEPKDDSPLKEIYNRQAFTSFEIFK